MKKNNFIAVITAFLSLLCSYVIAGTFTWTGASNTNWTTAGNWNLGASGIPSANDTVTITDQTNDPVLAAATSVKKFTMTSGILDCNSYTLTISAAATFSAGTINNGTVTCSGTSTLTFAGTTFGAAVNATGNNILLNGSRFNSTFTAVKKGTTSDNGNGGNYFAAAVSITDSGTGSFVLSNNSSSPDTFNATLSVASRSSGSIYIAHQGTDNVFNGKVTMYSSSSGRIYSNYYGTAFYNDSIVVNSTSSGGEYFGSSTGSCTLASGKTISIGSEGFDHSAGSGVLGTLYLGNFIQSGSAAINFTLTGSRATLMFGPGSSFSGALTISAPAIFMDHTRFLNKVNFTLSTASGYIQGSTGGNYFADSVSVINSTAATVTMGVTDVDTFATYVLLQNNSTNFAVNNALFLGDVKFKNALGSQTEHYWIASTGTVTIKGDAILDNANSATTFGSSGGNTVLDTNASLTMPSGSGIVRLTNVVQNGYGSISAPMSAATDVLYLKTGNNFKGPFIFNGNRIFLNGTTFNGSAFIKRTSNVTDACDGGNVFNGTTWIIDSVNTSNANRSFQLATVSGDDFNGNVTFKQYGSGTGGSTVRLYPAYTKSSNFSGDIIVDGNGVIEFGANGGRVVLDGATKHQSLEKSSSNVPDLKKVEVNGHNGVITLNYPLSISDTLFLTSGVLATDATNILTVPDNKIISGGTDSSYIYGPIKKIGDEAFTFPLGDTTQGSAAYHPLSISAPCTTSAAYTAQYFASGQTMGSTKVDSMGYLSNCEYWTLDRNVGTCQVKPTLNWNSNSCYIDTSLQRVAFWNSSKWESLGKGTITGTPIKGGLQSLGVATVYGQFILAQLCNITADITSAKGGTICAGVTDTITATPSGASSYQFFKNGTSVQTGSSDKYISSTLANGDVIKVKVINLGLCYSYDSLTMIVNALPSVSITTDSTTFCKGQTHTLTATGGMSSYLWSPGGATTSTRTVNAAGTYSVTVSNGTCFNIASQIIALYDTVQPTITVIGSPTLCTGVTTADLQATLAGAVNFLWSTTETTSLISVEDSAIYQVTCLDAHGCYVHNWQVITQANPPAAPIVTPAGTSYICTEDSGVTLTPVTFHVTNFSNHLLWSSSQETQNIEIDYEDLFYVTYTDSVSGCFSNSNIVSAIIHTSSISPDSMTTNRLGNEICSGDSITITLHGGYLGGPLYPESADSTYWSWYVGHCGDSLIGTGSSIIVHPITNTKYYLRAEGPCGTTCDSIAVTVNSLPTLSSFSTNTTCHGDDDGSITMTASGGTPGYNYLWNDPMGQMDTTAYDLEAGIYFGTVTDANGCTASIFDTVNQPSALIIDSTFTTSETCRSSSLDGSATLFPGGNLAGNTFKWNTIPEQTDTIATELASALYEVTITDTANACQILKVYVGYQSNLEVSITSTSPSSDTTSDGLAVALARGGIGSYTYLWSDTQTNDTATGLANGIYNVTVTDSLTCSKIADWNITTAVPYDPCDFLYPIHGPNSLCSFVGITIPLHYFSLGGGTWGWSGGVTTHVISGTEMEVSATSSGEFISYTIGACTTFLFFQDCVTTCSGSGLITWITDFSDAHLTAQQVATQLGGTYSSVGGNHVTFTGQTFYIQGEFDIEQTRLVFDNCTIHMAQGSIIYTPPSGSMEFEDTDISGFCQYMWQGIRAGLEGVVSIINSSLSDAEYGIVQGHSKIHFTSINTHYFNNYVSIYNAVKFGCATNIQDNDFDGSQPLVPGRYSGQTPMPQPLLGSRTFAAMEFHNLIYDSQCPAQYTIPFNTTPGTVNTFHDLNIGIYGENSNLDIYNCTFTNIHPVTAYTNSSLFNGSAIYCTRNGGNFNNLNVGQPNTATDIFINRFNNCNVGVFANGNVNSLVMNNYFRTMTQVGIKIWNAHNQVSLGLYHNRFRQFYYGILGHEIAGTNLEINYNLFADIVPHYTGFFSSTGIYLTNNFPGTFVNGGDILKNAFVNPRIGIRTNNCHGLSNDYCNISGNQIDYILNFAQITPLHVGIWIDNPLYFQVESNLIHRPQTYTGSPFNFDALMIGMNIYHSTFTNVNMNDFTNLGTEFHIAGDCSFFTNFFCNTCASTVKGFNLNNAAINDQGTSSASSGNQWYSFGLNNRLTGQNPGPSFNWYWNGATEDPSTNNLTGLFNLVSAPAGCSPPAPHFLNDLLDITEGNRSYEGDLDTLYFQYADQNNAYKFINENLNYLDSSDEVALFYSFNLRNNIGLFYSADSLANLGDYDNALSLLDEINDTISLETLKKYTRQKAYSLAAENRLLTEDEEDSLIDIAYLTIWEGGEAVFDARSMMNIEVDDQFPGLRLAGPHPNQEIFEEGLKLYPNPTRGEVYIGIESKTLDNLNMEVISALGEKVFETKILHPHLNLEFLEPGIYILHLTANEGFNQVGRITIMK